MGRFYIRVFKNGERERTWGCGSRGENENNLQLYLDKLLSEVREKYCSEEFPGGIIPANKEIDRYRFEMIKNRHGEKCLYHELEIELPLYYIVAPHYIICKNEILYNPHSIEVRKNNRSNSSSLLT